MEKVESYSYSWEEWFFLWCIDMVIFQPGLLSKRRVVLQRTLYLIWSLFGASAYEGHGSRVFENASFFQFADKQIGTRYR